MLIEEGTPHHSNNAVEFRWPTDDAWHPALLDLVVNMLFVTFVEVNISKNREVYGPYSFETLSEIEEFCSRFRPLSDPVRDVDCTGVEVGTTVSVINDFGNDDWRFYDGVVNAVNRVEHEAIDMEYEECSCEFRIFWKHGPLGGTVTSARLNNIHLLASDAETHHALTAFVEKMRQRFQRPGKRVRFARSCSNDRNGITLSKGQPSLAIYEVLPPDKGKMPRGGLLRARGKEKGLSIPGLVEGNEPTMSSSLPPLVSSNKGINDNRSNGIEFRSMRDDAWHGVGLHVTSKGKLVLVYDDYTMFGVEEIHEPDEFNTLGGIEDFRERFRPLSSHVSPEDCHEVKVGNLISVRYDFEGTEERRFYDAVVKEIIRYEHVVLDSEKENCFCSFEIFWKHGPLGGTVGTANIDRICLIFPTIEIDPALASFLDIARQELGRPRKRGKIEEQNPNIPPGLYTGDDHDQVTSSRGESSTRDKGKKICDT